MKRRTVLGSASSGLLSLAGCTALDGQSSADPTKPSHTEASEDSNDSASDSLTDWERSTDCDGEYDSMHDSVIRVQRVEDDLGDEYAPIHFADLSAEERDILRTVTEEGGYGTCDASDAFGRFVGRIADQTEDQDEDMRLYLEREGTYYGLYVERADEVYAY